MGFAGTATRGELWTTCAASGLWRDWLHGTALGNGRCCRSWPWWQARWQRVRSAAVQVSHPSDERSSAGEPLFVLVTQRDQRGANRGARARYRCVRRCRWDASERRDGATIRPCEPAHHRSHCTTREDQSMHVGSRLTRARWHRTHHITLVPDLRPLHHPIPIPGPTTQTHSADTPAVLMMMSPPTSSRGSARSCAACTLCHTAQRRVRGRAGAREQLRFPKRSGAERAGRPAATEAREPRGSRNPRGSGQDAFPACYGGSKLPCTVPSPSAASGVRTGTGGGCEGEAWARSGPDDDDDDELKSSRCDPADR